jgi:(E)-4-hydroxy-3-methylbut-2-enyl-diphosphate synthase
VPVTGAQPPEVRRTRTVKAGRLLIGGGFPVSVQTMGKSALVPASLDAEVEALAHLSAIGCDLVRYAVPDAAAAEALGELARLTTMPLAADIHFDHTLAMRCLDFPIAKLRINPGTLGAEWKVREVVGKAADRGAALRVGVNAGSLPRALEGKKDVVAAMVQAAEDELELLERLSFRDVVFSLKSSDIEETVRANERFARDHDHPLHLGVTEAGPLVSGIVRSTVGISRLLSQGIGDTIRVSLSAPSGDEVLAGVEILKAAGRRTGGVTIVSCPRCGRSTFDVQKFIEYVSSFVHSPGKAITIAVMGCPVNGPGEARKADLGITGAGKMAILFSKGEIVRRVPYASAVEAFREEFDKLCED